MRTKINYETMNKNQRRIIEDILQTNYREYVFIPVGDGLNKSLEYYEKILNLDKKKDEK